MSLLERCPHFRGWYVQASMELVPEDVSILERCPHFRGWFSPPPPLSGMFCSLILRVLKKELETL